MYLFLRTKKSILRVFIFANGKWQVFENFEFINFSLKEKRIKRQLYLDKEQDRQVTMEQLLLLIDSGKS